MATVLMLNKFRGSLVGALIGDCLGSFFEAISFTPIWLEHVTDYTMSTIKKEGPGALEYTDDSAMTRVICRSLLEKKGFDDRHMAYQFSDEFFRDSCRGYGAGVVTVFEKLRDQKLDDDFTLPAREQFDGTGSYGNGAAMRISPIALFSKDSASVQEYARRNALITHTHIKGVNGAILQAQAVFNALHLEPTNLDKESFIDNLVGVSENLEAKTAGKESGTDQSAEVSASDDKETREFSYAEKFKEMKDLFSKPEEISQERVVELFGNGIGAEEAVPAAIFAFLHKGPVSFEDSINYAISLGGDTDTIASMTGAICGAYWGLEHIPALWREKCEAVGEAVEFADKIYELRESKSAE